MACAALRPAARRSHVAGQDRPQAPAVRARSRMTDTRSPLRVAIYDLDRTVLRTPTFTLFLLWAAWREAPWRLLLLPALAALMIGHALRLYGRDRFKRSEEHTSELQSLMRNSIPAFCLKKKKSA